MESVKSMQRLCLSVMLLTVFYVYTPNVFSQKIQVDDGNDPEYYENIVNLYAPSEDAFIALQYLTAPYINKKDWKKAIKIYESNKIKFPDKYGRIEKIVDLLKAKDENIHMYNMGGNINSMGKEYGPVLSPDMRKIYFTGRDREDNIGGEDVFVSYYINNKWIIAIPLTSKINTESNEYINSISADGNTLVLFGNYINALGRGDNFHVEKTAKGWSEIMQYPEPINSKWWDADAFLSIDGKAILFSSERPGGISDYHPKGD